MAKLGRPLIQIDWDKFEKLCAFHCTLHEIASFFDCSSDTIERHVKKKYKLYFAEVYRQKSAKGKISLRRKMYEMALSGDRTMLIWLSKQYLGFAEKLDQRNEQVKPIEVVAYIPENNRTNVPTNSDG